MVIGRKQCGEFKEQRKGSACLEWTLRTRGREEGGGEADQGDFFAHGKENEILVSEQWPAIDMA